MNDYDASVEYDLIGKRWVISVRYVRELDPLGKRKFSKFVLVPSHQGAMFASICEEIEPAIEAHRSGLIRQAGRRGYSHA